MKKELRQKLRSVVGAISPEEVVARSVDACKLLFQQREYASAQVILVYLSSPSEIDTAVAVLRAWQDGKRVLAPKVSWEQRRLMPVEIRSLTDDLKTTPMGIREPAAGIPIPISLIDLAIVPGLGFDDNGNRLGRGQGFYDRFLSHADFRGVACALAFEEQVAGPLPVGPLDRGVDMLVTDKKVRRFNK